MLIKEAVLETVCGITSKLPENILKEIAFVGKSNVGKSSLINSILNRKSLARTSSSPGKTQTINFYKVNKEFYLVDLPGYGFAKVSEEVKIKWAKMINNYLDKSKMLKAIFLLIDIRHKPSENDKLMYSFIKERKIEAVIVLTKMDKIKRSVLSKHIKMIKEELRIDENTSVYPFSSLNKSGKDELISEIYKLIME